MSHFTVLVLGDNIEEQLDRYWEERSVPEYISRKRSDEWADIVQRAKEYYAERGSTMEKLAAESWSHLELLKAYTEEDWRPRPNDEPGYHCWTTYNPDSKWDWYEVGGRWDKAVLVTKNGEKVNSCKLYELDVDMSFVHGATHALVKDGEWYERGRMGWFATVSDAMSEEEWDAKALQMIKDAEAADPNQTITLVDCHI
ncbi:hypothetical protein ACMX2H_16055 [Arthrobacter sulfonylureivorans]|uniref:hypothetical protein n=1 Tax=Arthrobacter sulfonylureivorans TaxID=2486855 RepID=UPI0039E4CB3D